MSLIMTTDDSPGAMWAVYNLSRQNGVFVTLIWRNIMHLWSNVPLYYNMFFRQHQ